MLLSPDALQMLEAALVLEGALASEPVCATNLQAAIRDE